MTSSRDPSRQSGCAFQAGVEVAESSAGVNFPRPPEAKGLCFRFRSCSRRKEAEMQHPPLRLVGILVAALSATLPHSSLADVKPGDVITWDNAAQAAGLLPPSV